MKNYGSTTVIYTKPTCPFCVMAKQILTERGYKFEEIVIDNAKNTKQSMCADLGVEVNTVPQIVLNGTFIPGGCSGLKQHFGIA